MSNVRSIDFLILGSIMVYASNHLLIRWTGVAIVAVSVVMSFREKRT